MRVGIKTHTKKRPYDKKNGSTILLVGELYLEPKTCDEYPPTTKQQFQSRYTYCVLRALRRKHFINPSTDTIDVRRYLYYRRFFFLFLTAYSTEMDNIVILFCVYRSDMEFFFKKKYQNK